MIRSEVKGARKSVRWTDFSPERAKPRTEGRRYSTREPPDMLKGSIALMIRYIPLVGCGALASAGIITATVDLDHYCFNAKVVADAASAAIALALGAWRLAVGYGLRPASAGGR